MPINVVCPGCKKRFNVSDKYAGQKGPCPSCKAIIEVPRKEEDVVIHAPEATGLKDAKGKTVLIPILREETKFNTQVALVIGASVLIMFLATWAIGSTYRPEEKGAPSEVPWPLQAAVALLVAPPLAFAGYTFLRNDELEPYRGRELWIRVAACGAVYAVLWAVYAMLPWALNLKEFELPQLLYVVPPFILAGAFAAYATFELDFLTGTIHYGMYLFVTVMLRVVGGMNAF